MRKGDVKTLISWSNALEKEKVKLIDEVVMLVWYMRGGLSWDECMQLSYLERQRAFEFINKRMEKLKDHTNPIY